MAMIARSSWLRPKIIQAGVGTWQVIGGWSDEAPHLTQALSRRSSTASSNRSATRPQPSTQSHFDRSGQKLGTGAGRDEGLSGSMSGNGFGYKQSIHELICHCRRGLAHAILPAPHPPPRLQ